MRYIYALLLFSLFSVQAVPASAQEAPPDVIISEINWAGSSLSQADEWIELYNPNGQSVDIGGWILTGTATAGEAIAIANGTVIAAGSTLLIANYDLGSEKTTLEVAPDLVTASLSLSNSHQEIYLATSEGLVIDGVGSGDAPQAGSTDPFRSMERNLEDLSWDAASDSQNLSNATQFGTPGTVKEVVKAEISTSTKEESAEVEEVALTQQQLEECYALFMPAQVREQDKSDLSKEAVKIDQEPQTTSGTPDSTEQDATTTAQEELQDAADDPVQETESVVEAVDQEEEFEGDAQKTELESAFIGYEIGTLLLNEVVSDPEEGEEWVEIYNPSAQAIDLTGWTLQEGSSRTTDLPEETIDPDTYIVVESINGNLNNGGDELTLIDPASNQIDFMRYGGDVHAPEKGQSLIFSDGSWLITDTLTPGQENITQQNQTSYEQEEIESATIVEADTGNDSQDEPENLSGSDTQREGKADVVSQEEQSLHRIVAIAESEPVETINAPETEENHTQEVYSATGVITATPGTFGDQMAFIDGKQLYFYHADWPTLALGDVVRVIGEPSTAWNEERIKIAQRDDIQVIDVAPLYPEEITTNEITKRDIGTLVRISGSVLHIDGNTLTLQDEQGTVEIVANTREGMRWSDLDASQYTMTGIVRTRNDETKIYVRDWSDVQELERAEIAQDDTDIVGLVSDDDTSFPWGSILFIATAVGVAGYWLTKYKLAPYLQSKNSYSLTT